METSALPPSLPAGLFDNNCFLEAIPKTSMEVILMVGIPGSGKTTLAKAAFPSHVHVSLDRIRELPPAKKLDMLACTRAIRPPS